MMGSTHVISPELRQIILPRSDDLAKMIMLRLNIGSGMLRLSSCMLSIGHGP